ncbi:MAG: hypothetical protein ACXVCJ_19900 [Polyangiales bacterium]
MKSLRSVAVVAMSVAAGLFLSSRAFADDPNDFKPAEPSSSATPPPPMAPPPKKAAPAAPPTASAPATDPNAPATPPKPKAGALTNPDDDPLVVPEGIKSDIGSSYQNQDQSLGERSRTGVWPFAYKERLGNQITTSVFPFYWERRTFDEKQSLSERESFYTLYYRKRTRTSAVDAVFPLFVRWRDEGTTTTVVPPVLWRDAPQGEWHRWIAPLFFASSQPDGGYFHAPLLLTFSHHNPKRAFSLIGGLGFYDRTEKDIDWGVAPFVFAGSNADKLTSYFLIPPLLTYHSTDRDNGKQTTLIGPVLYKTSPKSTVFDVFPLFLHNHNGPDAPDSSSTTLIPFFHVSHDQDSAKLITPLFMRSRDKDGTTIVTPFYSQYRGRTTLDLAGPIIPLFAHYHDPDIYKDTWLTGPILYSQDPTGWSVLTPLFGHWKEYGVSQTTWVFPTFQHTVDTDGWSFNIHPLLYLGKDTTSSHTVLAPFWWDFVGAKKRATVAFPVFWRFRDEEGITQLALNTLYLERASSKGPNWDFYFLPFVHVGEQPNGNAWDFLFGFVGYKREGTYKQLKLFWIPIDLTKNPAEAQATVKPAPGTK